MSKGKENPKHRKENEMSELEKKIEIINSMVKNGYNLMGRTVKSLCDDFTVADLLYFHKCFSGKDFQN